MQVTLDTPARDLSSTAPSMKTGPESGGSWFIDSSSRHGLTAVGEERVQAERPPARQLPRRWVVERRPAWITGNRRTSRDYEPLPAHAEAMIQWAMIDGPPPCAGA